jgi:hypothetical protein
MAIQLTKAVVLRCLCKETKPKKCKGQRKNVVLFYFSSCKQIDLEQY